MSAMTVKPIPLLLSEKEIIHMADRLRREYGFQHARLEDVVENLNG